MIAVVGRPQQAFTTRDTVIGDAPALRATSWIVVPRRLPRPGLRSDGMSPLCCGVRAPAGRSSVAAC